MFGKSHQIRAARMRRKTVEYKFKIFPAKMRQNAEQLGVHKKNELFKLRHSTVLLSNSFQFIQKIRNFVKLFV